MIWNIFGIEDMSRAKCYTYEQLTVLRMLQHELQDSHLSFTEMAQVAQRGCGLFIPGDDQICLDMVLGNQLWVAL